MAEPTAAQPLPLPPIPARLRALGRVVALVYRRDPWRTVLALVPVSPLVAGVVAISGQAVLGAHGTDDSGRVVAAAVVAGVALLAATVVGYWQAANGLLRLVQVAATELDTVLLTGLDSVPTIDLFDDPGVVDRLEVLRAGREPLINALGLVGALVGLLTGTVVTASLYGAVDGRLALLPVLMVPVVLVYHHTEAASSRAEQRVAERRRLALHLFDVGTGPAEGKELRVLGHADALVARHDATWAEIDDELSGVATRGLVARLAAWTAYCVVIAIVLGVVLGQDADAGALTPTGLFLVAMATAQLVFLASNGAMVATALRNAADVAGHLGEVQAAIAERAVPERPPSDGSGPEAPTALRHGIVLRGVTFRYPGAATDALGPVDVDLPAGTVTALVGANGAGKTTMVDLLLGLRRPTGGALTVDGVPLDQLPPGGWYAGTSVVTQDFARFELPAREAVGAGDLARLDDDEAIATALERGEAGFVTSLPQGLDTVLGPRLGGRELSGGQWQRIAMARGLMRPAPLLLVLDEPTVSMDAVTEQRLLERCVADARSLAAEQGTVVVFVSHRYATARLADQILVVEDGVVVEGGSHRELVALDGRYADVYRRQAEAYRR